MARVKKYETALTLEEKLEQALVPDWEWPYKLPPNWCWTRTGHIAEIASGGTPSSSVKEYYEGGNIPWISPVDLSGYNDIFISHGAKSITSLGLDKSSARLLPENTVCLSSRAPIGYVAIAQNPICTNQGFKNFLPSPCYLPKYLYWYLKANKELLESYASGTTFLELSASKVAKVEIPLAPLAEQQRIVDRIESLFVKLDEAKEKAQATLDSFETRKAAILHKAFTGELTAEWRAKNNIENSWKNRRFDTVAEIRSNLVDPAEYQDYPHIAPDNIEKKTGVLLEYNTIAEDGMTSGKHRFFPGQILYSKIRPYLSKVVIVNFDGLCSADMYPIQAQKNARCLWYYMLSEEFLEQASSAGSRSVLPKINQKELSAVMVNLPDNEKEQEEIVAVLDSIFAKEQQAKEAAEMVLDQIDLMKKAILSRAFRGELGTNDPTEESAVELLKQIL